MSADSPDRFEASRGAKSIAPPPPAPKPQPVRPAYIPVPKVSDIRKQNQVQRLRF